MTGEDHLVERRLRPGRAVDDDLRAIAHRLVDGRAGMERDAAAAQATLEPADVFHAAAVHRPPLVLPAGAEKRVVAEELDQRARRKGANLLGRRRPDRARERGEIVVLEPGAEAHRVHELADGGAFVAGQRLGLGVEPQDVAHHPREPGAQQVAPLRGERGEGLEPVFDPAAIDRGAEAHVAPRHRHVEIAEQLGQVRVIGVVEDDEAGIDRLVAVDPGDDRARVPPEPRRRFEQRDGVAGREKMRGGEARNAAADDGDTLRTGGDGQIERHADLM